MKKTLSLLKTIKQKFWLRRRINKFMSRQRTYENYSIGRYTYGSPSLHFTKSDSTLTIGQFCSFADQVKIFLGGEHRTDWITTYPFTVMRSSAYDISGHPTTKGDVIIGNDVWIGHGATILSGVTIADGSVVGAHAVVTRDVPPYAIVTGNPARVVRQRFSNEHVAALLKIKWWNWPIDKIDEEISLLLSGKIEEFIDKHSTN